jgi:uncharacterized membrane protein
MTLELALRFLHLAATVVFLGDIVVGAVWKWRADQSREPRVIAWAQRQVMLTDRYLLIPSIAVLVLSGYASARLLDVAVWTTPTYAAAQVLFILSGLVWSQVLRPVQLRQLSLAEGIGPDEEVPAEYFALARRWLRWGLLALALPIGSLFLMVYH